MSIGILEAMAEEARRKLHWTDVLVERLRSGRGSAISGQRRGRDVENFVETVVKKVFGSNFQVRLHVHGFARAGGKVRFCNSLQEFGTNFN